MKKLLLIFFSVMSVTLMIGCQKDEGAAEVVPCGPGHYVAPAYGNQCLPQAQCQPGYVQNPTQPSMCMHMYTGASGGTQQCGAGYVLTTNGCLPQCPNQPGKGLLGNSCVDGISGGYNGGYQQYPYGGGYYGYPYQQPYQPYYPYFRY